jgi:hypothetical protein
MRGEIPAHPALVDAVCTGHTIGVGQRTLKQRLEFVSRFQAERPLVRSQRQFCFL